MRTIAILLLLCSPCFAQIELSASSRMSVVGLTEAVTVGDRTLVGMDSKPTLVAVAIVKLKVAVSGVQVFAVQNLTLTDLQKLPGSETDYMLVGSGEYLVIACANSTKASIRVTVGQAPRPPPIPPEPLPPDPIPVPPVPPVPDVPNEFNLGKLSYSGAPADAPTAKLVAGMYRTGAGKLFGQGALLDIVAIIREIDAKFDAKQCVDKATCDKWGVWKNTVNAALIAEQRRRMALKPAGQQAFSRQEWFSALTEIASGLEAVKVTP